MRSRVHDTLDTASQMIHDKFCGGVCSAAHLEIESLRDAQATIAALQARVRELEARCQRAPLDHETVCHACDGSGWVERGY